MTEEQSKTRLIRVPIRESLVQRGLTASLAATLCCVACSGDPAPVESMPSGGGPVTATSDSAATSPGGGGGASITTTTQPASVDGGAGTSQDTGGQPGVMMPTANAGAGGLGPDVDPQGTAGQGSMPTPGGGGTGGVAGGGAQSAAGRAGTGGTAEGGAASQAGAGGLGGATGAAGAGAELPSYVPNGYELAYEESFAEPSSLDELLIANDSEWFHALEGYVEFTGATYTPPYRSPFSLAVIRGVSASSFVMEVELLQTSTGEGHRDMIIAWNVVSPSEFYYAHVSEQHDDVAHHVHIVDSADRAPITEMFTPGFDWGTDVWRTLRVVRDAASGSMEVYDVDEDELILSATDATFTTGFFGFGSFDNTGRVRNVRIWSPDATVTEVSFSF